MRADATDVRDGCCVTLDEDQADGRGHYVAVRSARVFPANLTAPASSALSAYQPMSERDTTPAPSER
jgi:hypothetical protein